MLGKAVARFRRDKHLPGLFYQGVSAGRRQRLFPVQRLIHGDDELGQRVQPREPRVLGKEFEKMVGRWNRADGLLVADALRIHQRLVQIEQRVAELLQP